MHVQSWLAVSNGPPHVRKRRQRMSQLIFFKYKSFVGLFMTFFIPRKSLRQSLNSFPFIFILPWFSNFFRIMLPSVSSLSLFHPLSPCAVVHVHIHTHSYTFVYALTVFITVLQRTFELSKLLSLDLRSSYKTLGFGKIGKYAITNEWCLADFKKKILEYLKWEITPPNSDPFHDPLKIYEGTYPIYCSFFFQVGLTIPFDPLLVDFLRCTRFHLGQLTPTVVRVVLGVTELNRRFDLHLDFDDLNY